MESPLVEHFVGNVRGLSVLDLGCGTGRHSIWLAAAGATVTAIDFSEGMLAEARKKPGAESVRFLSHDLHNPLPFDGGSFDVVVSGLVLEHLNDLNSFFADAYRILKPGGSAVISAMHPAMFLRGVQAQFHDPDSKEIIQPGSIPHSIADFVMASLKVGFQLKDIREVAPHTEFAQHYPRAVKYIGWPMLVVMSLKSPLIRG
jgi:malonyl-CoA O-methyltransferase